MNGPRIRVFVRPDCHLCGEALASIEEIIGEERMNDVEVIDIDSSDHLLVSYLERIPVVEVADHEVSALEFDGNAFRAALGPLGPTSGPPGQVA